MKRLALLVSLLSASISFAAEPAGEKNAKGGVDALRVNSAIDRSLSLLEKASAGSADNRKCFTCHSQALPVMALAEAKLRGFKIDQDNFERQIEHTAAHLDRGKKNYLMGQGQGGRVDTAGYALWTLEAGERPADEVTDAVVEYLLQAYADSGRWKRSSNRPPSEASDFTTTYLALRALAVFGPSQEQARIDERVDAATKWLLKSEPKDTEDRVFRLRSADYVNIEAEVEQRFAQELLDAQRDDGGWSQLEKMDSDPYATGTALVALVRSGHLAKGDEAYQRGLQFLLDSQQEDGSWHIVSRSKPFQKYFETGFPHGKDQFISTTASSWATIALLLSLPEIADEPSTEK